MNAERIRTIAADQKEALSRAAEDSGLIDREALVHWEAWASENIIKVITGARRAGKSIFAMQLLRGADGGYAYVNFDDERLVGLKAGELDKLVEAVIQVYGGMRHLILDEVQNLECWEMFVNRLQRQGFMLTVTGSNARMLSSELATHLTGRHVAIEIFPFSFREFLSYMKGGSRGRSQAQAQAQTKMPPRMRRPIKTAGIFSTGEKAEVMAMLREYIEIGGFPEATRLGEKDKGMARIYLQSLCSTIIGKDVVERHRVKYLKTVREIADFLISSYSSMVSFNSIMKSFGLQSLHTAKNYASYIEESYLIFFVSKHSCRQRESNNAPKKAYCIDTGMVNAMAFRTSENIGRLMENIVAVELMRIRSGADGNGGGAAIEVYYWRDYRQREVDFVIKKGAGAEELLQVTYASERGEVAHREVAALLAASDELKCRKLSVITWDYEGAEGVGDGSGREVRFVPLWRWLLGQGAGVPKGGGQPGAPA